MANFSDLIVSGQDTFTSSATQLHPLGTKATTKDGRLFRYGQVGATATVAGSLYQMAAPLPNHLANTPPAVAVGATSFSYTPGATGGAANLYAEGYLQVDTTPGEGYTYQVASHGAITASTAFTLNLRDAIQVALTTSSRVGLIPSKFKSCIVCPTAVTGRVAGVAPAVLAIGEYGWFQTHGPASVLINGTPAITSPVANSATTPGAVDVWTTAAAAVTITPVGYMMQVGVSTKLNFVDLAID
jgi:hypothetical protein